MKLKFEHLIAYLPYELKGFCIDDIQCVEVMNGLQKLCDDCVEVFTDNEAVMDLIYFKPILFPLSSLTKEITINGETFNPYDELTGGETVSMSLPDYSEDWDERTFYGFERYVNEWIDGDIHHLDFLPFGFIQKLLEWKIDVFSLIDAGLAEPVTEEFNPYK